MMHPHLSHVSRRRFLTLAGGAAALATLPRWLTIPEHGPGRRVVLFQGDSITDAGRDRGVAGPNVAAGLGTGYPLLIAARALADRPTRELLFYNRGVSGNTVPDLQARWQADTVDLNPDIVSILIGVNDYWHTLMGTYKGNVDDYEAGYTALLRDTAAALPHAQLVVLEPFVLRCGVVTDAWFPEFDRRRAAAARVAKAVRATFVELQSRFDRLSQRATPQHWSNDGVHPTPAGHNVIAQAWLQAVQV
jgi:lysophospholipase L1-like esterase